MATLLRSSFRLANFARNERLRTHVARPIVCRSVHAIKKNDTMTPAREDGESDDEYRKRLEKWFADDDPNSPKNIIQYDWDPHDKKSDDFNHHYFTYFWCGLTTFGVWFLWAYHPNRQGKQWAMREAHFVIERREKLGLDPIDVNYIDPSKMPLPTDEELGDFPVNI